MFSNLVRFDKLRGQDAGSIQSSYTAIGFNATQATPAPFTHAMRVVHFINTTDQTIIVSFDNVNDNIIVPSNTFTLYDLTSDQDHNESFRYQNGSQIYIKYLGGVAPLTGTFYVVCVYGLGE